MSITLEQEVKHLDLKGLTKINPLIFQLKIGIAVCLFGTLSFWVLSSSGFMTLIPIALLGLVYAHAVELQHQCLHNTAYKSKAANRLAGFLTGAPLLVSFSDYQYHHMRHHRNLGTPDNREFFDYRYEFLQSIGGVLHHFFMVKHYQTTFVRIAKAMILVAPQSPVDRKIHIELRLIGYVIVVAIASSYFWPWAVLKLWFLPLLVGVPAHAMIEIPEHIGCTSTTRDILQNTRTIKAGWFGYWFTNGNNYHVEHHWMPSVPNDKFAALHPFVARDIKHLEESYWAFYRKLFSNLWRQKVHDTFAWQ